MRAMTDTYQQELRKLNRRPVVKMYAVNEAHQWETFDSELPDGIYGGSDSAKNASFGISQLAAGNDDTVMNAVIIETPPQGVGETDWLSPSATGEDYNTWGTTPSNAFTANGVSASPDAGTNQDYYNFNIEVPVDAIITGITFELLGVGAVSPASLVGVELSWNGGTNYTSTGKQVALPPDLDFGYVEIGGEEDTWGRTWSVSELSNGSFRVRLAKVNSDFNLDHLRLKINYITALPEVSVYVRKETDFDTFEGSLPTPLDVMTSKDVESGATLSPGGSTPGHHTPGQDIDLNEDATTSNIYKSLSYAVQPGSKWLKIWTGTEHRILDNKKKKLANNIAVHYDSERDNWVIAWYAKDDSGNDHIYSLYSDDDGDTWSNWDGAGSPIIYSFDYPQDHPLPVALTIVNKDMSYLSYNGNDVCIIFAAHRQLMEEFADSDSGSIVHTLSHLDNAWDADIFSWSNGRIYNITDIDAEYVANTREIDVVLNGTTELDSSGGGSFYLYSCKWYGVEEGTANLVPNWSRLEILFAKDLKDSTENFFQNVKLNRFRYGLIYYPNDTTPSGEANVQYTLSFSQVDITKQENRTVWAKASEWDKWSKPLLLDESITLAADEKVYFNPETNQYFIIGSYLSRKTQELIMVDLSSDILSYTVNESDSGNASTLSVKLNNNQGQNNKWVGESGNPPVAENADIITKNATIILKEGFITSAGEELIDIGKFYIDDINIGNKPNEKSFSLECRNGLKKIKNYSEIDQRNWESQLKFYDDFSDNYYPNNWTIEEIPGQEQSNIQWESTGETFYVEGADSAKTIAIYNSPKPIRNGVIEAKINVGTSSSVSAFIGVVFRYLNFDGQVSYYAAGFLPNQTGGGTNNELQVRVYNPDGSQGGLAASSALTINNNSTWYVRVIFNQNRFWAYYSQDGITWTKSGSKGTTWPVEDFELPQYEGGVGLIVENHDGTGNNKPVFDNFKVYDLSTDKTIEHVSKDIAAKSHIFNSEFESYFKSGFQNQVKNASFSNILPSNSTNDADNIENNLTVGTEEWFDEDNAKIDDNNASTTYLGLSLNGGASGYLKSKDFGFNIPKDATITGITAQITKSSYTVDGAASYTGEQVFRDSSVRLVKNDIIIGNNKASSKLWPVNITPEDGKEITTYGNPYDTWGINLTPNDINNSNFGVVISVERDDNATSEDAWAYVYYVSLTIYYTQNQINTNSWISEDDEGFVSHFINDEETKSQGEASGQVKIIQAIDNIPESVKLYQDGIIINPLKTYILSFYAKADIGRVIQTVIKRQDLEDNFDDNSEDTTKWGDSFNSSAIRSEVGGRARITLSTTPNDYAAYASTNGYNLTDGYVRVEVPTMCNVAEANAQAYLQLAADGNNTLEISQFGGTIYFRKKVGGAFTNLATATYDEATHKWWRIREEDGVIYWDTSEDGITWVNRASDNTPITITELYVQLGGGTLGATTTPGLIEYDNFRFIESLNQNTYLPLQEFNITDKWQRFFIKHTTDNGFSADTNARLQFNLNNGEDTTVWLDGIQLESVNPDNPQDEPSNFQDVQEVWTEPFGDANATKDVAPDGLFGDYLQVGADASGYGYSGLKQAIPADFRTDLIFRLDENATGLETRIIYRSNSPNELVNGYMIDISAPNDWSLKRLDAGTPVDIGGTLTDTYELTQANAQVPNHWNKLTIIANGGWHTILVNDTVILSVYDDTYLSTSVGSGFFIVGGGMSTDKVIIDNINFPQLWQPVPGLTLGASEDAENKLSELIHSNSAVYRLNNREQLIVKKLKESDTSVWEFRNQDLLEDDFKKSDKEIINETVVFGWFRERGQALDLDNIKELGGHFRSNTITDEKLIGQYAVDERAKMNLALSKIFLEQPDFNIDGHPGLEVYDVFYMEDNIIGIEPKKYRIFSINRDYNANDNSLIQGFGIGEVTGLED